MPGKIIGIPLFFVAALLLAVCSNKLVLQNAQLYAAPQQSKGLKDYYKNYFLMGVAVSPQARTTNEDNSVINYFNSLTPENEFLNRA